MLVTNLTLTGMVLNSFVYFKKDANGNRTSERRGILDLYLPSGQITIRVTKPDKVFEKGIPEKGEQISINCCILCDEERKPIFVGYALLD